MKTSVHLYRDCLRLVKHIAGKSSKGNALRMTINTEFKKNAGETDPHRIEVMKSAAIRGLANYLMMESTAKDARFQQSSQKYNSTQAASLNLEHPKEPKEGAK